MILTNWEFTINEKKDAACTGYWMRKEEDTNIEVVRVVSSLGMYVVYINDVSVLKSKNKQFKIELFETIEQARLWCDLRLNDLGYKFIFSGGL